MHPEQLMDLLTSREKACQVAEAIDNPTLQRAHGWNLMDWTYVCLRGVIFFVHHDDRWQATSAAAAVKACRECRNGTLPALSRISLPTKIVLLDT